MATPRLTLEHRFWAKVDRRGPDECWTWLGNRNQKGYGRIYESEARRGRPAHQVAWELEHNRSFPNGTVGCHTCDNPNCVNPRHIWAGTHRANVQDMIGKGRRRLNLPPQTYRAIRPSRPTGCEHPRTPETMVMRGGRPRCRLCERAAELRYRAKQEQA